MHILADTDAIAAPAGCVPAEPHQAAPTGTGAESFLNEAEGVIEQVVRIFSERGEAESAREAKNAMAELQTMTQERHMEMCTAIRELSAQLKSVQEHSEQSKAALSETTEREKAMLRERKKFQENVQRLKQETVELKKEIGSAESRATELGAREQQIRHQESVEVPRARHTISLYANISSIRWDYSSDMIKGFITSVQGKGIKAFELDPTQHSSFNITNNLWELMDS
mmetsp:Transcript_39843/g.84962  ORF Transcript_39843/g.84962 Transcript_39843/m.84962 type:complete len:227 (-) Transcript_39843:118-798(-)